MKAGPVPTRMTAGTVVVGVRLRPSAGGPVLGVPLSELRDQRVDLAELRSAARADFAELKTDFAELRSTTKADVAELTDRLGRIESLLSAAR